jgi:hypothetical protein
MTLNDWLNELSRRFPRVADDLLETVDDYLSTDERLGPYALQEHKEIDERIARLMNVRERLAEAREGRESK